MKKNEKNICKSTYESLFPYDEKSKRIIYITQILRNFQTFILVLFDNKNSYIVSIII